MADRKSLGINASGIREEISSPDFNEIPLGKITNYLDFSEIAAPALSPAGSVRLYFDSTSKTWKISENGGAYEDVVGAGGGGDFADGGEPGLANRTLGNTDAFSLGLKTNNNVRVHLESDGRVGIGSNASSPSAKAEVDISSSDKGFLIPRLTTAERDAITSPPIGLEVFNVVANQFQYWDGVVWKTTSQTTGIRSYLSTKNPTGLANPLTVYRFDNASDYLLDRVSSTYDLSVLAGAVSFSNPPDISLVGAYFDGSTVLWADDVEALRLAKEDGGGGSGKLTLEMILHTTTTGDGRAAVMGSSGESLGTNYLYDMETVNNDLAFFAEYDAGSNISNSTSGTDAPINSTLYVVLTASDDGLTRKVYVNGVLVDTFVNANAPEKDPTPANNSQRLRIGGFASGDHEFTGWIMSLRLTADTFSDAQVEEVYNELVGTFGGVSQSGGVVSGQVALWDNTGILKGSSDLRFDDVLGAMGVNTVPNSKAAVDIASTDKGFLIPRLSTIQRDAISSPPLGLRIYNVQANEEQYFDGVFWRGTSTTVGIRSYLSGVKPPSASVQPLVVYRFDNVSDYLDDRSSGTAYDATFVTNGAGATFSAPPDVPLIGMKLGAASHYVLGPDTEDLRVAKDSGGGGDASLTIEMIIHHEGLGFDTAFSMGASGSSYATNVLFGGKISFEDMDIYAEHSASGTLISNFSTDDAFPNDTTSYFALTISADGLTHKLYINGVLAHTFVNANPGEKDTSGNTQRLRIGANEGGGNIFDGWIMSYRMTKETFSDAVVSEAYAEISGLAPYSPVTPGDNRVATFDANGQVEGSDDFRYDDALKSLGLGAAPNSKAAIVMGATDKGLLIPRLTDTQRDDITSPPIGLEIFNKTSNLREIYNNDKWQPLLERGRVEDYGAKEIHSRIRSYLPTDNPAGVTASPLALYVFDNITDYLSDRSSGTAYSLTLNQGIVGSGDFTSPPDISLVGLNFNSVALRGPDEEALRLSRDDVGGGDASSTIEIIFHRTSAITTIYSVSMAGNTVNPAGNRLYNVGHSTLNRLFTEIQYQNGFNEQFFSYQQASPIDETQYVAITTSSDGLTKKKYINGRLEDSRVFTNYAEKDTSGNNQRLWIGSLFENFGMFGGWIMSVRITAEEFDAQDVLDVYNQITSPHVDYDENGDLQVQRRLLGKLYNRTIASVSALTLGIRGNLFEITGTTTINTITTTGWTEGSEITLHFASALTVNDHSTSSGNIKFNSGANYAASADTMLNLILRDGFWYEK